MLVAVRCRARPRQPRSQKHFYGDSSLVCRAGCMRTPKHWRPGVGIELKHRLLVMAPAHRPWPHRVREPKSRTQQDTQRFQVCAKSQLLAHRTSSQVDLCAHVRTGAAEP